MTAIAVFSGNGFTHLIADTLVSSISSASYKNRKWLSTGVNLSDVKGLEIKEGLLKIWVIQNNLAIAFSGNVDFGHQALHLIYEKSKNVHFESYRSFKDFVLKNVFPSILPSEEELVLIGFFVEKNTTVKFGFDYGPAEGVSEYSSDDPDCAICGGSGKVYIHEFLRHVGPSLINCVEDPELQFLAVAGPLYIEQIYRTKLVQEYFAGGAITGVYGNSRGVFWQGPTVFATLGNIGGVGVNANFKVLNYVFKIWEESGNIITMSLVDSRGEPGLWVVKNSNPLSKDLPDLIKEPLFEMSSFNAENQCLLLVGDISNANRIGIYHNRIPISMFNERFHFPVVKRMSFSDEFFKKIANEIYIDSERNVVLGIQAVVLRLQELATLLEEKLESKDLNEVKELYLSLGRFLYHNGMRYSAVDLLAASFLFWEKAFALQEKLHNNDVELNKQKIISLRERMMRQLSGDFWDEFASKEYNMRSSEDNVVIRALVGLLENSLGDAAKEKNGSC